ncbi:hypothetical protein, partial [Kribbella hippodromi]|uniref:hypothetical protein n=1 Tax=Kribbella hippodromi TaxID=434347 RepID=UPI0031D18592
MSFENLPPTWTDHPLTDPAVTANVIDLMLTPGDRHHGTLAVILCTPTNHYQATLTIDLPPTHLTKHPPAHPPTDLPERRPAHPPTDVPQRRPAHPPADL